MAKITPDEHRKLKTGETTPIEMGRQKKVDKLQEAIDAMSTKDFLIGRTQETIQVPVHGLGGSKNIEVRARLSKSELKPHQKLLTKWSVSNESDRNFIESKEDEKRLAEFLEYITIDKTLTAEFWMSDDLAPEIVDEILSAYFVLEPARRMVDIQKFLGHQLRPGICTDVTGVAPDPDGIR